MMVYVVRQGAYLLGVYTTLEQVNDAAERHAALLLERGHLWINEVEVDRGCVCHPEAVLSAP